MYVLGIHVSIVVYAHRQTNTTKNHDIMTATKTETVHRLRWRLTYSYRGSRRRRESTAYATAFTGDGDSSVHAYVVTQVPGWGHTIRKVECANHAMQLNVTVVP